MEAFAELLKHDPPSAASTRGSGTGSEGTRRTDGGAGRGTPPQIRRQSRKRATRRGQAEIPLRVAPIRAFAKPARQGVARAALLGRRLQKPRPDAGAEPPLQLFHDPPKLQTHRKTNGRRGTRRQLWLCDGPRTAAFRRISCFAAGSFSSTRINMLWLRAQGNRP